MPKPKDLSPKFSIKPAELELEMQMGQSVMGDKVGGLSMYANSFKRGYGNNIFGSDENGIWLGSADFPDAPFSVSIDGNIITRATDGTGSITISSMDKTILINDGTHDRVLIGFSSGGF